MKFMAFFIVMFAIFAIPSSKLFAHCQVPCGIYDDDHKK